jgi:hypothetical protein
MEYNSKEYILIPSYFQFMLEMALYGKKVTDIPHIGVIINFIMDESGIFNIYTGEDYSDSILKTKCAITDMYIYYAQDVAKENLFYKIQVGTGTETFPNDSVLSISSLNNAVYEELISVNEVYENDQWVFANCTIPANRVNIEKISVFSLSTEGSSSETGKFYSGYLDYGDINYNLFELTYTANNTAYTVTLTQDGVLIGDAITGTVNLDTGYYEFYTYKDYQVVNEVIVDNRSVSSIDTTLGHTNIIGNSIKMYYWISGTQYIATDDGIGNISGTGISSGSVDYDTGAIDITFTNPTDAVYDVVINYEYRLIGNPENDINVEYSTNNNIEITEAGIFDDQGNLLVYANFPPTLFHSYLNHHTLQFFIEKKIAKESS